MTGLDEPKARVGHCRAAARRLLKEHGVTAPGTPLLEMVEKAGFRVLERNWGPSTSGILLRERMVIGVNRNHAHVRRRFSIAHEWGHHVLAHHLWYEDAQEVTIDNPPQAGCAGESKTPEREADIFAGELLIPLAILKKEAKRGRPPKDLAGAFDVSEPAMFVALQNHRLLDRL